MGRGPEMALSVGQQIRQNGIEVVAIIQQPEPDPYANVIPGSTAKHEAAHIVVARKRGVGVRGATIIPDHGKGYNGATFVDSYDGPSFMAAHAEGHSGTGHDVAVTVFMGENPDSNAAVARDILLRNGKAVHAVAAALQVSKSLGRTDIDSVISDAEKKKELKATIFIKSEGQQKKVEGLEVQNGIVIFDAKLLTKTPKEDKALSQNEFELVG